MIAGLFAAAGLSAAHAQNAGHGDDDCLEKWANANDPQASGLDACFAKEPVQTIPQRNTSWTGRDTPTLIKYLTNPAESSPWRQAAGTELGHREQTRATIAAFATASLDSNPDMANFSSNWLVYLAQNGGRSAAVVSQNADLLLNVYKQSESDAVIERLRQAIAATDNTTIRAQAAQVRTATTAHRTNDFLRQKYGGHLPQTSP